MRGAGSGRMKAAFHAEQRRRTRLLSVTPNCNNRDYLGTCGILREAVD